MTERQMIQTSKQVYDKLSSFQHQISQIIKKKVSLDQTINIIVTIKSIDQQLADLITELEPKEWRRPKKKDLDHAEDPIQT
jgi:predicted transcriptional regulator